MDMAIIYHIMFYLFLNWYMQTTMRGTIIHPAKVTTYQNLLPPMTLSAPLMPRGFCWLLRKVSVSRSSLVSSVTTLRSRSEEEEEEGGPGGLPTGAVAGWWVDEGASNLSDGLYTVTGRRQKCTLDQGRIGAGRAEPLNNGLCPLIWSVLYRSYWSFHSREPPSE